MNPKQNVKHILIRKGVRLICPESIDIGNEVNPDRISATGVTIYPGSKIYGAQTLILAGATLGYEAPVTLENCYVGPFVKLRGGFFKESVFFKNTTLGSCAHVREGCILEEEASAGHAVGLKQTILFPYVTLGSMINFCDCLMSGGTGKKNHSEVGSSYIHFNFTPLQDKATPSLLGDVPKGVMLDQPPIFLGGQGGMVGPCRLGFGVTVAAGTICRTDELRPHRLIFGGPGKSGNIAYMPGSYRNVGRILNNNLIYLGNLFALAQWYAQIRIQFISDEFPADFFYGVTQIISLAIDERIRRLKEFMAKLNDVARSEETCLESGSVPQDNWMDFWPKLEEILLKFKQIPGKEVFRHAFQEIILKKIQTLGKNYLEIIHRLGPDEKMIGTQWLQDLVDQFIHETTAVLPSMAKDGIK